MGKKNLHKPQTGEYPIDEVLAILRTTVRQWKEPIVTQLAHEKRDPFEILITTVLSLRTKDATTLAASRRLFALAQTPEGMLKLSQDTIAATIFPVGFYKAKAASIHDICRTLIEQYSSQVPDSIDELLKLRGVGRKTANLVVGLGFGTPAICVDTHVHRITNRWGYVSTKTPEETEMALRAILPKKYWISINDWLVTFGQNLCVPVSPWCSRCPLYLYCARVGVTHSR